jgi:hypothetical protein
MDDLFGSDGIEEDATCQPVPSISAVKLRLTITKENVGFLYKQRKIYPTDPLNKEYKTEQAISGFSEPVDNSNLPPSVFRRQPHANKIFEGRRIYVHIIEKPAHPYLSPFALHTSYFKEKLTIRLQWEVSDRSLFTRLVSQLSFKPYLTIELTTSLEDDAFAKHCEDPSLELPGLMGVTGLWLR